MNWLIKTFTGINLVQSLHVCKPWCKRVLVWYPLAHLHGLKQKYFQHCDVTTCPAPRIENIPNHDTTVSYRTEPWILWTVTPLKYTHTHRAVPGWRGARCEVWSLRYGGWGVRFRSSRGAGPGATAPVAPPKGRPCTHTHTHTHTHSCWFCYTCGDSHRRNGFCTVQTVYSIALHQPYT